ncbi:MAG TPA: hypothetical protein VFY10_10460 [Dehalococcoidia bacterium]|nr:hypothetical protein [Dehalococcoidia bacterium]
MFGGAILSALNPAPIKDAILGSAADVLGISQAELQNELTSGKDLNQIAQEHNVSIDQLKTQLNQKATNLVSQARGLGLLTPDEANNVTSQLLDRVNSLINKTFGQPANATATSTP